MTKSLLTFLSVVGLTGWSGCLVGPDYHPPKPKLPPKYSEGPEKKPDIAAAPESATTDLEHWWKVFNDPELDSLIARATDGNRDLKMAVSRVRQARAERSMVSARLGPEVDGGGSYAHAVSSHNGPGFAAVGTGSGPATSIPESGQPGVTENLYQAGFDAIWEMDIFGGTRRAVEAANASIDAAEEARRNVLVSLLAEVATTYLGLRSEQQQLTITRENLQAQREALSITQAKLKSGFATDLDVARQTAQVAQTASTMPALESAERDAAHTLAFLLGVDPNDLVIELVKPTELSAAPPDIPVGVPSDLLRRRPDVRRAERQMAVATAEIGVATADLFPKFDLTAAFGLSSTSLKHLPDYGSRYLTFSPTVAWPVLDWGRVRSQIHVENELQQQAVIGYEDAVAKALRDVEDALVHYQKEQVRRGALTDEVNASRRSFELARDEYTHGLVDQLSMLEAQGQLLSAESRLAQSDSTVRTNVVALYKALGGGWKN